MFYKRSGQKKGDCEWSNQAVYIYFADRSWIMEREEQNKVE